MIRVLLLVAALLPLPAFAGVQPHEMLEDPALEARAQGLDEVLRCIQCRSESLASSNADWAEDARRLVRELIAGGKTDDEVLAFFQARYGDYVLMDPPKTGGNLVLWLAAPVLGVLGLVAAVGYVRSRRRAEPASPEGLSEDESARLAKLMEGD